MSVHIVIFFMFKQDDQRRRNDFKMASKYVLSVLIVFLIADFTTGERNLMQLGVTL